MESDLIVKVSDNIISPLGDTSLTNYQAVKSGQSALCLYENNPDIPEAFVASLIDREKIKSCFEGLNLGEYTFFEKLLILSVSRSLQTADIDAASEKVLFILSTTKGNVDLLDENNLSFPISRSLLGEAAKQVSTYFKNPNMPLVVSNACTSGLCAQIAAMRSLQSKKYEYVVVMGADCQSPFIISGFQSFKALSPDICKPFDRDRIGLNLGEAAASVIYTRKQASMIESEDWIAHKGAIRNDANHISGPSRTAEGGYRALSEVVSDTNPDDLAFINTHGTATVYNDETEAIAIQRSGLLSVPVNGLKGYYGHTMGAAGIVETIISMYAVDDRTILATRGYDNIGVSQALLLSNKHRITDKKAFVKLLSGFGGCNSALLFKKGGLL